jgi:polyisoprenyl-phosphate glycosyltransferase
MSQKTLITVIVPVLNEVENVAELHRRLSAVSAGLEDEYRFEFLFTDNRSTDGTFELLRDLAANDARIRVLRFSKDFGFQRSILTGYLEARGDAAIQIDADMQDPPELIPRFLSLWRAGNDVVFGIRGKRHESRLLGLGRKLFYRIINWLSEDELPADAGDFRLVDRKVVEVLRQIDDYHPYLRGLIASFGFEQVGVPYDRAPREHGESKFSIRRLISLAADGILLHSVVPLRIANWIGLVLSAVMLGVIGFYLYAQIILDRDLPAGFVTTTVLIMTGIILNALFLGIIGAYLGRIYQQVKRRPITIVEQRIDPPGSQLDDVTDGPSGRDGVAGTQPAK